MSSKAILIIFLIIGIVNGSNDTDSRLNHPLHKAWIINTIIGTVGFGKGRVKKIKNQESDNYNFWL